MRKEKLYLVGSGPGDETVLTVEAKNALKTAQRVLNTREMTLAELTLALETPDEGITVVLVSGDSGFFSVTKMIVEEFSDIYDIEVIAGVGSIQYFSAKLKIPYEDAAIISLHGRSGNIVPKVAYNRKVFALTGGKYSARGICHALCRSGLGGVYVCVGERLSYPDERIAAGRAVQFEDRDFDNLSVIYIENLLAVDPHVPLHDDDFIRGGAPMTKEEIRWLSIQKLGVSPRDTVYDIGAGTGSVAVEMARMAFDGFVYAIEVDDEACVLVRENLMKHGAMNIEVVHGKAPEALGNLPAPDKAFIGGSSGNMDGILEKLTEMNPGVKIVVNAITLRTLNQVTEGFEKHGIAKTDMICVNISKSKKTGGCDMMTAQNPVYIITGTGGGGNE